MCVFCGAVGLMLVNRLGLWTDESGFDLVEFVAHDIALIDEKGSLDIDYSVKYEILILVGGEFKNGFLP